MVQKTENLDESVLTHAKKDFCVLYTDCTVGQAMKTVRNQEHMSRIGYFYAVDRNEKLAGVIPARKLLTASLEQPLADIMLSRTIALPHTATLMDACQKFIKHKFLAFPVIDDDRRILGVVDISLFTEELVDVAQRDSVNEVFELIGLRATQLKGASSLRAFRFRFPWLFATIVGGTFCAFLASVFETTLAKSIILTFFLTLMLGLSESVSMQSMTLTIHFLRKSRPSLKWYLATLRKETSTAVLLGAACGTVVGLTIWFWKGELMTATAVGCSILFSLCSASIWGLSIPVALHGLKLDPKIAAGPVTLAISDVITLLFYFGLAALLI